MKEKSVKVDGYNIRYLVDGKSKKNLLLVHGLGASAERWEHVIPNFAKNYRVIVPDLPGFGKSDKFSVRYNYTYEGFVDWMSQFIESLDLKNITLFCQDLDEIILTILKRYSTSEIGTRWAKKVCPFSSTTFLSRASLVFFNSFR